MEVVVGGRWIFNFFLIALPWWVFSMLMMLYNVVFNAWLNKGWALGNFYLMANTVFCFTQWSNSVALAFEFPFYMRGFVVLRWLSVFGAFAYNGLYFFALGAWLWQLFDQTETELQEVGAFDVLLNMFFIYNCILHSSIVVINLGIIFKEFNIEFYEMFTEHGEEGSDYNLALNRVVSDIENDMWFLDPVSLFKATFEFFAGETVTEEVDKYPDLAGPWDSAMETLGEYSDYGATGDQHFRFVPYDYSDPGLDRYINY
jgi:hypothetical protein